MKGLHLGLAVLVAVVCSVVVAASSPAPTGSAFAPRSEATHSCTKAERARRAHRVATYSRQMEPARRAYFKTHRSSQARLKFVRAQNTHLKALQRALDNCRGTPPPPLRVCTQTVVPGASLASTIAAAAAGSTLCLASGSYGNLSLTSVGKSADVTVQPASGADVTIDSLWFRTVAHLRFTGTGGAMKIGELTIDSVDGDPTWSHHLTFDHITWTAGGSVYARGTDQAILFDSNVWDNLVGALWEGRLTVRGYNNPAPVGVTITNSHFGGGGCSDGVQVIGDAYGVQIGPGNEFEDLHQGSCSAHVDPVQLYGSSHTLVTGNYFHDNSTGIMAAGGGDHEQFFNNVFVVPPGGYPQVFQMGGQVGTVIRHNTFAGTDSDIQFCGRNAETGAPSTGCVVRDNVYEGSVYAGDATGEYIEDHNLCRVGESRCAAPSDIHAAPVYVGGANPTTYAGFRLAPRSPGKGAASDGTDIGIGARGLM
jgi:hypothetical protein